MSYGDDVSSSSVALASWKISDDESLRRDDDSLRCDDDDSLRRDDDVEPPPLVSGNLPFALGLPPPVRLGRPGIQPVNFDNMPWPPLEEAPLPPRGDVAGLVWALRGSGSTSVSWLSMERRGVLEVPPILVICVLQV